MTTASLRARYVRDAVTTASPARLLVMLFDRLLLDLSRAEIAQLDVNREAAGALLGHAQAIVVELRVSLDVDAWDGAGSLAEIYNFWLRELVAANVECDPERTVAVRAMAESLAEAWRAAAAEPIAS